MNNKSLPIDAFLLVLVLTLSGLGLVMLLSSSTIVSESKFGDPYYFFRPQTRHMLAGLVLMFALYRVPYQFWIKMAYPILIITVVLLAAVLIPGIGYKANGAYRWIRLPGISIQPSEMAKIAMVFYMAYSLSRKGDKAKSFFYGFVPHLMLLGAVVGLILLEPDLGTAACVVLIVFIMMFVAGSKVTHMVSLFLISVPLLYWQVTKYAYRMDRIKVFLNPWIDPQEAGYHIIHSYYAFANGGLLGQGPGAGQQKLFFLPEAHTDFIFSVVAEELGFLGVGLIGLMFLALCLRGLMISRSAKDMGGVYMAIGCTMIVSLTAFINMGVVTALIPTKGMPLPFFSYGGSNLLVCYAAMGILLNVAAQSRFEAKSERRAASYRFDKMAKTAAAIAAVKI